MSTETFASTSDPFWQSFPLHYRATEIKIIADWINTRESGAVVGLAGVGRATLLGFLCHRPDALQPYLWPQTQKLYFVPVDLNNLPADDLATLYRVILRSFYENQGQFPEIIRPFIYSIYRKYEATLDPFLSQSGLRELLLYFQEQGIRIVLVMNRFDRFCRAATYQMTNTLRGLRDSFKNTLIYIMGMRQEVIYLSDLESIRPFYALLDTHVCRVKPLTPNDSRFMLEHLTTLSEPVPEVDMDHLFKITGGYPALLRVVCHWYLTTADLPPYTDWCQTLIAHRNIQHRLESLWRGLNQEEQLVLTEIQKLSGRSSKRTFQPLERQYDDVLQQLSQKGVCQKGADGWSIVGELVAAFIGTVSGRSRGKLWLDKETNEVYQGQVNITGLAPQEQAVLQFLLEMPRVRHTHTELIEAAWPEEMSKEGVSTESLYQAIRGIRKKIEPNAAKPRYVITWRGQPEGGYQLFPEGKPG